MTKPNLRLVEQRWFSIFTLLLFTAVPFSHAANHHWKVFVPGDGEKSVSDDPPEIKVGDWICSISRPYPFGPFGGELRSLECRVGENGLKASVTASCEPKKKGGKPVANSAVLGLEQRNGDPLQLMSKDGKEIAVMLKCY
jgi:hypothetical protein